MRAGSPAATIKLDSWSERDLGALLMLFFAATVQGGAILGVNPYGQPGVEAAKIATMELLANPEGAESAEIARILGEGEGASVP